MYSTKTSNHFFPEIVYDEFCNFNFFYVFFVLTFDEKKNYIKYKTFICACLGILIVDVIRNIKRKNVYQI